MPDDSLSTTQYHLQIDLQVLEYIKLKQQFTYYLVTALFVGVGRLGFLCSRDRRGGI